MTAIQSTSSTEAAACEFIATTFLVMAVVGSGIAAERLSGGNTAVALLVNALATSGALFVLVLTFGGLSGAHMNPVVTLAAALISGFRWRAVPVYIAMQVAGAFAGIWLAHVMFALPVLEWGSQGRSGAGLWIGEVVATLGLLGVIWGCLRYGAPTAAGAIAAYVGAAYWFTSSTSFANPAVTLARAFTDTFAGIRPMDAPAFIAAQLLALVLALPLLQWQQRRIRLRP